MYMHIYIYVYVYMYVYIYICIQMCIRMSEIFGKPWKPLESSGLEHYFCPWHFRHIYMIFVVWENLENALRGSFLRFKAGFVLLLCGTKILTFRCGAITMFFQAKAQIPGGFSTTCSNHPKTQRIANPCVIFVGLDVLHSDLSVIVMGIYWLN